MMKYNIINVLFMKKGIVVVFTYQTLAVMKGSPAIVFCCHKNPVVVFAFIFFQSTS